MDSSEGDWRLMDVARVLLAKPSVAGHAGGELAQLLMPAAEKFVE